LSRGDGRVDSASYFTDNREGIVSFAVLVCSEHETIGCVLPGYRAEQT
jgi:hypothetical protein